MSIYIGNNKVSGNALVVALPMFFATYQPRKLNNASWLRADPYSWHSADVYVSAYAHLADNISGVTAETETIAGTTITYYRLSDEIKVVLPDQQTNLDTIYNATGIGYYFVLDTTNRQFKLPRNTYGFTGYRGDVGGYVSESLPNVKTSGTALQTWKDNAGSFTDGPIYKPQSTGYGLLVDGGYTNTGPAYFNLNTANGTYQDNAPVQERATQAYLYFYVGNTVQNETSVDVAELAEDLNDKADIDLGNLSNAGKIVSAKMSMPGDIYIDVTPGASGDTYTALSDGYFLVNAYITSAGGWFSLRRPANGYMGFQVHNPYQGAVTSGFLPVKKGDVVELYYAGITFNDFRFIYAEGSESEA